MNNSLLSVNQVAPSEAVAPKAMRFESLQIFRGLAAVSVVLYHAMCYTRDELGATPLLNWLIPGGSGVDFFLFSPASSSPPLIKKTWVSPGGLEASRTNALSESIRSILFLRL